MSTIFISHASEDKQSIAKPLADILLNLGYEVWYDEFSLKIGDSLRRGIDSGLAKSTFGIVILSNNFFNKEWPQKELDALTTREASEERKLILPVWHNITAKEIATYSPMLADKVGVPTQLGLETVVEKIIGVIGPSDSECDPAVVSDNIVYNFSDQNVLDWRSSIAGLFNNNKPSSKSWTSLEDITRVLNQIAKPNLNHCFFPDGGGEDLERSRKSHESGCIELEWSHLVSIVKAKSLRLEVFPGLPSLSYFRLDADSLEPWTEDKDTDAYIREELAEIGPKNYYERWVLDAGYYGHNEDGSEIPTPSTTRVVTRYFRGSFVIFAKGSKYNNLTGKLDGYNGQHNDISATDFRAFISNLIGAIADQEVEIEPDLR